MSTPLEPVTTDAPQPAAPPKRRGMQGSAKSMVLSMIACLAGCLVLLALIPRQGTQQRPTVDDTAVAQQVSARHSWDVAVGRNLSSPWRPVTATYDPGDQDHSPRWIAGYQGKGSDYMAVQQAAASDASLVKDLASGADKGSVNLAGVTWRKVEVDGDQKALVRDQPLSGLKTVVNGTVGWDRLSKLAESVTPIGRIR